MIKTATKRALVILTGIAVLALLAVPIAEASSKFPKTLRIAAGQKLSNKMVKVGLNRSLVIELGEDASDVLVASPTIADAVIKSSRRVYILGVAAGQSSITIFGRGGRQIANFIIAVEPDTGDLEHLLRTLMPHAAISASAVNGSVVLTGEAANALDVKRAGEIAAKFVGDADKVVNMVGTKESDQVHLKVVIAEVQRTIVKQLGVDLAGAIARGTFSATAISSNPFSVAGTPITDSLFNVARTSDDLALSATFRALQEEGFVKTLAEPTLTAVSGESASFLVGGEFPIPIGVDEDTITIEFKEFGVGLNFTPVVLSGGRISLKVKTEVSELSSDNSVTVGGDGVSSSLAIPGLTVRRADTVVEMPSGGSLVLAGLIKDDIRQTINGIPGLLQVPILGALFKSRDYQKDQTELVVFVTPYLVDPVATSKLQRPDQNLTFASDAKTFFLNQVNRVYRFPGSDDGSANYHGNVGFIYK